MEEKTKVWLAGAERLAPDATPFVPSAEQRRKDREEAVAILLGTIDGETFEREGLLETPKRVAKMYDEIFSGYQMDPKALLSKSFAEDAHHEMVIVKDIPFYSHCEHHMVPFFGHAHIAYIPNGSVVGLSKLARLVDCYSKRLQIQERLTSQIADMIDSELSPMGVMVVVQAEHLCMSMRGVKKPGSNTITSAVRGVFKDSTNVARAEFLSLIDLKK